jgi:hypothetical protein
MTTNICAICKQEKPAEEFGYQNKQRGWLRSYCRPCHNKKQLEWRNANREKARRWSRDGYHKRMATNPEPILRVELKRRCKKYGVTVEWWTVQLAKQNNVCALCLKPEISEHCKGGTVRSLAIDHHHENGTARGLLCSACNQAVGKIEASPGWLERATKYLKEP